MAKRPIEISIYTYQPNPATSLPSPSTKGLSWRTARSLRSFAVASVCLAVHALLVTHVMWSAGAPVPPQDQLPARVSMASTDSEETLEWIALDPMALSDPSRPKIELPAVHLRQIDVRKTLAQVAVLIPDVDLPSTPDATVADAGRLSKMYGRYVSQISARIDRAWLRPRTPIGSDSFSCEARITQDATGNVREVMLEHCNGDSRWQLSLVQAIQSASPLPAPPDPDVFSRTVKMAFTAEAYTPQRRADEYEPEMNASAVAQAREADAGDAALTHLRELGSQRNITISITGDHRSVTLGPPPAEVDESSHIAQQ